MKITTLLQLHEPLCSERIEDYASSREHPMKLTLPWLVKCSRRGERSTDTPFYPAIRIGMHGVRETREPRGVSPGDGEYETHRVASVNDVIYLHVRAL